MSSYLHIFGALNTIMQTHPASSGAVPTHGRHPNYTFLMKGEHNQRPSSGGSIRDECGGGSGGLSTVPSIACKPYVYWFTGRKWPSTLYHRPMCETASFIADDESQLCDNPASALHCTRYEIVGSPVVVERYRISKSDVSLCRMMSCAEPLGDTHVGGATMHINGLSKEAIIDTFMTTTRPLLLPEEGRRDASWSAFTTTLADTNSESSASCTASMSTTNQHQQDGGRCSTASSYQHGCLSSSSTPNRDSTTISIGGSPEPLVGMEGVVRGPSRETPIVRLHMECIDDLFVREKTYGTDRQRSDIAAGWLWWRQGDDIRTLDRRSVIASVHEIMSSNRCSRAAFHLCVALLDAYLGLFSDPNTRPKTVAPSSANIRGVIACAISIASKCADIYPPPLDRLVQSLGAEVMTLAKTFDVLEANFLAALHFRVHPVTAEEVMETIFELYFGHTSASSMELPHNVSKVIGVGRYLLDLVVRSSAHATIPPTYVGAAVAQYAIDCVQQELGASFDGIPRDAATLDTFIGRLVNQGMSHHAMELVRQCHQLSHDRPVDFLEKLYSRPTPTSAPVSMAKIPCLLAR